VALLFEVEMDDSRKQKPKRKHHYIPAFYLRGFTGLKDDTLWVYDKEGVTNNADALSKHK